MKKQRQDSASLYEKGGRQELLNVEKAEIEVIDTFFDSVMVNVDDIELKQARLKLINRVRSLFLSVADISYLSS